MDEEQWQRFDSNVLFINIIKVFVDFRLINTNSSDENEPLESNLINRLQRRQTFIKFKPNGRTYSRIYYLISSQDAIHYLGSKHKAKHEACMNTEIFLFRNSSSFFLGKIKDIDQVRYGFTTAVWKKCLRQKKITLDNENLAFSILYDNNRYSLDLLAETEDIRSQWIQGLEYLINRHRSYINTHHEITHQWIWYLFSQVDHDHSGHLNRSEVRQLLFSLNIELDERDIDQYFNQANIRTNNYEQLANLDKDEFLLFYKFVSYRPELIKIICQYVYHLLEHIQQLQNSEFCRLMCFFPLNSTGVYRILREFFHDF
jgi:hypothetical protein